MIPILYEYINLDIVHYNVPEHYGVGALIDCLSCRVKEERNGSYELEMEYAANGQFADRLTPGYYIKAKPNFTDDPQLFRIYNVGKNINGRFTVNAEHFSYLLSDKVITNADHYEPANNIVSACVYLNRWASPFTITTTKNTPGEFKVTEPSSVRSWLGGKQGSLLDVYGGGEWHYDNFTATLMQNRGEDRGVTIRYGKNLLELSQENTNTNTVDVIIPYYIGEDGTVTEGAAVRVQGGQWFPGQKEIAIDFSQDVVLDSDISIEEQLETLAENYISNHNLTTMLSNIKLDFVQIKELAERVDLCDTVHIYFEPLGISAETKCISTTWDVLEERYIETEFGDPRTSIVDTFQEAAAETQKNAEAIQEAYKLAGGKAKVFIDTPVPPYDVGDIWVNGSDIYYCIVPKTKTVTGEVAQGGTFTEFTAPIEAPLLRCVVSTNGLLNSATITVADENGDVQATYSVEFDPTLPNKSGYYNILEGVVSFNDETTQEVTPLTITTLEGYNRVSYIGYGTGRTEYAGPSIEYLIEGFQLSDWNLAANYISESRLEDAIRASTEVITGANGGHVILHDVDDDGKPDEILVMDTDDINTALKLWRWNAGGLGFSSTGYNGPFIPAMDSEGRIVADMISTGNLDALKVTIEHLTATMFEGGKISLGGLNNQSGVLELKDETGTVIGELTKDGLKFYGAGPVGQRPYVILNNTDGFKGFDAFGNPLFWVNRDEFNMTKCVAVNEISACGMIRMIPMTIERPAGTIVNKGLAFIPIV